MGLIRPSVEQIEYLQYLYKTYNTNVFHWNDVKDVIPKGVFRTFHDNRFIKKDGLYMIVIPRKDNLNRCNTSYVSNWKIDMVFAGKYVR